MPFLRMNLYERHLRARYIFPREKKMVGVSTQEGIKIILIARGNHVGVCRTRDYEIGAVLSKFFIYVAGRASVSG